MDDQFDISRRKALAALGTIGVASAGAGLGTSAYFSDQETFDNNSLVAGTLDVGVAYSAHYSDWSADEDDDLAGDIRMPEGQVGGSGDLEPGEVGLPANDAWLIAVESQTDAEQFLSNTQYDSYNDGSLDCVDGEANSQADGIDRPVIELDDVKPGDFGEITFDFVLCDNPGFVWLDGTLRAAAENGLTEPEADDPDEEEGVVELLDVVQAAVWIDDGNNYQNGTESPITVGSIRDVLGMLNEGSLGTALNGDIPAEEGGGAAGARNCFSGGTQHSVVFAWWVPVDHGNEIQSDSATFDLGLYAEQCRHNDGSGMNDEPTGDPGGDPGDGTGEPGDGSQAISFLAACVEEGRDVDVDITVTEVTGTDDDGDATAVKWEVTEENGTDDFEGIDVFVAKYSTYFTTYFYEDPVTSGEAITGENGSSVETTSQFSEEDQTPSDPCPDGYVSAGKEEADELGILNDD
ncbi:M73 family metallopeptidase [Haloplanus rubicundus]|uniref:M73 family metallopeptidase n=1 Tax=Haloplanus rubicundus TaxID=1547898 RepID=UPI001CA3B995|nr:M73 family metallopeptidase [Haloplanus rubicundus]